VKPLISRTAVLVVLSMAAAGTSAWGQSFPSRPIRIIMPTVAGSAPDVRTRQMSAKLAEALGQPVIVENRPGGNGIIAAREAARAAPDGHTLLLALINNSISDVLKPDPCCRLNRELVPVSRFAMTPLVIVVNPSLQVSGFRDLLDQAKAKPQAFTYASGGPGSITQLLAEWIKSASGAPVLEVPYKSVGAEMPDILSGQVSMALLNPLVVLASLKAGKLRALAVSSARRLAILPDVPTLAEAGLPGIEAIVWNGFFVPAGTPQPVIQTLHRELVRAFNAPDVREQVTNSGGEIAADSPEEFAAFVRAENEKWSKVIRDAGIKPD
jgi:tripartite-type tricarboxylate transporter receptor subunit TctC